MQRKVWRMPNGIVQKFVANEYIAACYDIRCNVPSGTGYYETNGIDGYQESGWQWNGSRLEYVEGDERIASGTGCGIFHQGVPGVPDDGPRANAMWQESRTGNYYPVYHWVQRSSGRLSDHFVTLDNVNWEPNPNAS